MSKKKKLFGVDLGGTTIKFGITTIDGEVQKKWSIPTDVLDKGCQIVPDIIASINTHIKMFGLSPDDFAGIGMGTPGTVDRTAGTVNNAFNLNWSTIQPVKNQIQKGTKLPFIVDNDADVATLGERWKGAGDNADDVIFMTLGTGVGGGIINGGHLQHGVNGAAGEIGHLTIHPGGYRCTCGKYGCLETYVSAHGIVHLATDYAQEYEGSSPIKQRIIAGNSLNSKFIFDTAKTGDYLANEVTKTVSEYLGLAIADISNTLNPKYVVIGGGVSAAGKFLLDPVRETFIKEAFRPVRESTEVKLAELGNDAGIIGAASLALKFVDDNDLQNEAKLAKQAAS